MKNKLLFTVFMIVSVSISAQSLYSAKIEYEKTEKIETVYKPYFAKNDLYYSLAENEDEKISLDKIKSIELELNGEKAKYYVMPKNIQFIGIADCPGKCIKSLYKIIFEDDYIIAWQGYTDLQTPSNPEEFKKPADRFMLLTNKKDGSMLEYMGDKPSLKKLSFHLECEPLKDIAKKEKNVTIDRAVELFYEHCD